MVLRECQPIAVPLFDRFNQMLLRVAVIALLVMALTPLISAATVQLVYTCDDVLSTLTHPQ